MRLRRRRREQEQTAALFSNQLSGGASGCTWTYRIIEPKWLSELDLARTIARHASELVDRLLAERATHRALLHDYFPRVAKARVRLAQWHEGDGKPREVLADLERILG
jgi:hypothetical protein